MDQKYIKQVFNYAPETGIVTWNVRRSNRVRLGGIVGYKNPGGYLQVRLEKKLWMLHRLIWLWMTGDHPKGEIDHKNGDRQDNRWNNLRDVDKFKNMQNRKKADKDSCTGVLGVCFDKQSGKFRAQRVVNGRKILNKLFTNIEDASEAYRSCYVSLE